jgi:hypothetical protein
LPSCDTRVIQAIRLSGLLIFTLNSLIEVHDANLPKCDTPH